MKVDLWILIGSDRKGGASKSIDLDFAPGVGMQYNDGTRKGGNGREIISVSIEAPPDEKPCLYVALQPDESAPFDVLREMYQAHGWQVSPQT